MNPTPNDKFYAGRTPDGKLILTAWFAKSIRENYRRLGLPQPSFGPIAGERGVAMDSADDDDDNYLAGWARGDPADDLELDELCALLHGKSRPDLEEFLTKRRSRRARARDAAATIVLTTDVELDRRYSEMRGQSMKLNSPYFGGRQ
jgi:hypothetical protein